jgi:hypothetical protein
MLMLLAFVTTGVASGVATPGNSAQAATAGCPEASAVSAATGSATTSTSNDDSCSFEVGDTEVRIEFIESANATALYEEKRTIAKLSTAPVVKLKVGKYPGFTATSDGQARLYYKQNKLLVYVSHAFIGPRSAGILKAVSTGLAKTPQPSSLTSCAKITAIVTKAVPDAKYSTVGNNACSYDLADESVLAVGTTTQYTYNELLEIFQFTSAGRKVDEFTSGSKPGFAYQTFDTKAVINLGDRVAEITVSGGLGTEQAIKIAKILR